MYKSEVKKIDGFDCSITNLDFFTQMSLKRRLLTPVLKAIPSLIGGGGLDSDIDLSKLSELLEVLDENTFNELTNLVLKNCTVNGEDMSNRDLAENMLASNTVLFYKLIWFFLEVNYSDFLSVIRTTLKKYGLTWETMTKKSQLSSPITKKSLKKS